MTVFSNFFSNQPVQGQQFKGQNLSLKRGVNKFIWPIPGNQGLFISQIMNIVDVSTGTEDVIIELPPANEVGTFKSILFVNKSSSPIVIHSSNENPLHKGKIIKVLEPYVPASDTEKEKVSAYFIYLESDKTVPGTWFDIAFGASGIVVPENAHALNGNGLAYNGQSIFRITNTILITDNNFNITDSLSSYLLINRHKNDATNKNVMKLPAISTIGNQGGFFVYVLNVEDTNLSLEPNAQDKIDGANAVIIPKNVSFCICVDQNNPHNWITFSGNNISDEIVPMYLACFLIDGSRTVTKEMNSSTLICESTMTKGINGSSNIYNIIELTLPDPETIFPGEKANGFNFYLVNNGDGNVKLTSSQNINGFIGNASNPDKGWFTLGPRKSCQVVSNGVDYFTLMHGISSGQIIFLETETTNIFPSHFGANFVNSSGATKTIDLSAHQNSLWAGFRVTVSAGIYEKEVVYVKSTKLNGYDNTNPGFKINSNADNHLVTDPFGTSTFVFTGEDWWQI